MATVAEGRFGPALASAVTTAWRGFSAAFREFPFHISVVYSGSQQLGPANLLWPDPTGYQATMVGFPYDDVDAWRGPYPAEIFIQQLDKVANGFASSLDQLRVTADGSRKSTSPAHRLALEREFGIADAIAIHFRSVANQMRFVLARRAASAAKSSHEAAPSFQQLEAVLKDEISLARRLHRIQSLDSRIGFEASNQYYYIPADLSEKILNCRYLLDEWLPEQKRKLDL